MRVSDEDVFNEDGIDVIFTAHLSVCMISI